MSVDVAVVLQPVEHLRPLPALLVDGGLGVLRKNAGDVVPEPAAGDVGKAVDLALLDELEDGLYIDSGRSEEGLAECVRPSSSGWCQPS